MALSVTDPEVAWEQLACQAQAGCASAFDELSRRVSPTLMGFLRKRSPTLQDAEDLRQETLLKVLENLESYDSRRPFKPWLMTIASRLAAARGRLTRPAGGMTHELVDAEPQADAHVNQREAAAMLWKTAAELLPAPQYRALRLRYADQLAVKEVATAMGVGLASAKVLLFRGRRRLMNVPEVRALLDAPPGVGEDSHEL